jgi:hypothetical protein
VDHEALPTAADALVSGTPGDLLVVRVADCLPVIVVDVDRAGTARAVAAIHVGWRGLLAGVLEAGLEALPARASSGLLAALGPAIGPCCFEVGSDVVAPWSARLGEAHLRRAAGGRWTADLPAAVASVLAANGVEVSIATGAACTRCHPDRFFSHRAAGAAAGRMAGFVGLLPG